MAKKFFTMAFKGGAAPARVEYTPFNVQVGAHVYTLALHLQGAQWTVSDPRSGYRLFVVAGSLRGIRTSSAGVGMREARELARAQVLIAAERVGGPETFRATLLKAPDAPAYVEETAEA